MAGSIQRAWIGWVAPLLLLLGLLAGCSLFREPLPTPRPTTVAQVTADEVAQAMDQDRFYSTYGQSPLLVRGSVAALDPQPAHFTVVLATRGPTQVLCDLGNQSPPLKVGDLITVRSADPEHDVERQPGAALIKNCTLAAPTNPV